MLLSKRSHAARGRRTAPEPFYRFEDQANDILRVHVRHLDVHRRSVLLFYLVFGLIAGFIIGLVGARSSHAATNIAEPIPVTMVNGAALFEHQAPGHLASKLARSDVLVERPAVLLEMADTGLTPEPERYAALVWPDHVALLLVAGESSDPILGTGTEFKHKPLLASMLISIVAMAGILSLIVWTHGSHAHSSRRRVALRWSPR